MSDNRIVLASGNQGKLRELQTMLAPTGFEVVAQSELHVSDADETGLTFIENAIIKARHAAKVTGLPALADDSGLAVDALGGAPGIYSARYASDLFLIEEWEQMSRELRDHANNEKLLALLARSAPEASQRSAAFHSVLVYLRHANDPVPIVCHGKWQGTIQQAAAGQGGFGYDPLFFVPEHQCSSAELDAETKNSLSHRGQAIRLLLAELQQQA